MASSSSPSTQPMQDVEVEEQITWRPRVAVASRSMAAPAPSVALPAGSVTSPTIASIFVDYSNIATEAQKILDEYDITIRVDPSKLVPIIESVYNGVAFRSFAMSTFMPQAVQAKWNENGYKVMIGEVDRFKKEVNVDAMLQDSIAEHLASPIIAGYRSMSPPMPTPIVNVLVLLTGDGKLDAGKKSFPSLARRALSEGWHVHVWAWQASINAEYKTLAESHPASMCVIPLDKYRPWITFKKW